MRLVLLPGMDGTGDLFKPLIEVLPDDINPLVISYPLQKPLPYADLIDFVRPQLPANEDFALLGESFSGPIALALAAEKHERMRSLILVCTFHQHPRPLLAALSSIARMALRMRPPKFAIQSLLTNGAPDFTAAALVQAAIGRVQPEVLGARLRALADLPLSNTSLPLNLPCLYFLGLRDRLVLRSSYEEIQTLLPQIKLSSVDGPHCLLQIRPKECAVAILNFLKNKVQQ
jgi:pimeloyl-ACP methyl ester carboxylesterase